MSEFVDLRHFNQRPFVLVYFLYSTGRIAASMLAAMQHGDWRVCDVSGVTAEQSSWVKGGIYNSAPAYEKAYAADVLALLCADTSRVKRYVRSTG